MLRRIRGALSVALIWALAWLPFGVVVGLWKGWVSLPPRHEIDLWFVAVWTLLGACAGGVFAILLAALERYRTLSELSPRRLAAWGAIGGAGLPVAGSLLITLLTDLSLASDAPGIFALMALLGATCAWMTLRIARRGRLRPDPDAPRA